MDMEFVELEPMWLACVEIVGPYDQMPAGFERVMGWAGQRGLLGPDSRALALYRDDPAVPEAERRSAACVSVPAGTAGDDEISVEEFGGPYAKALHVGPYERLPETYADLMEFVTASGRSFRAVPPMESYLDGPETPPEQTRTEVYIAVE